MSIALRPLSYAFDVLERYVFRSILPYERSAP